MKQTILTIIFLFLNTSIHSLFTHFSLNKSYTNILKIARRKKTPRAASKIRHLPMSKFFQNMAAFLHRLQGSHIFAGLIIHSHVLYENRLAHDITRHLQGCALFRLEICHKISDHGHNMRRVALGHIPPQSSQWPREHAAFIDEEAQLLSQVDPYLALPACMVDSPDPFASGCS